MHLLSHLIVHNPNNTHLENQRVCEINYKKQTNNCQSILSIHRPKSSKIIANVSLFIGEFHQPWQRCLPNWHEKLAAGLGNMSTYNALTRQVLPLLYDQHYVPSRDLHTKRVNTHSHTLTHPQKITDFTVVCTVPGCYTLFFNVLSCAPTHPNATGSKRNRQHFCFFFTFWALLLS